MIENSYVTSDLNIASTSRSPFRERGSCRPCSTRIGRARGTLLRSRRTRFCRGSSGCSTGTDQSQGMSSDGPCSPSRRAWTCNTRRVRRDNIMILLRSSFLDLYTHRRSPRKPVLLIVGYVGNKYVSEKQDNNNRHNLFRAEAEQECYHIPRPVDCLERLVFFLSHAI